MSHPTNSESAAVFPYPNPGGSAALYRDPAPSAWERWLGLLENPFFLLDARVTGRTAGRGLLRHLLVQSVLLLLPLLVLEGMPWRLQPADLRRNTGFLGIVALHALCCALAGVGLGNRVLSDEHQRGNLDALRLISRSPWAWVPLKGVFPLTALLLFWAAGLPFYTALALRGHLLPDAILPGALPALGMGLCTLTQMVQSPPESWPGYPGGDQRPWFVRYGRDTLLHSWSLGCLGLYLVVDWFALVTGSRGEPYRLRPFFGWHLRSDVELYLLLTLLALAALGGAYATAMPANRSAQRLRQATYALAVGAAYLLWLSHVWSTLAPAWKMALPVLPLVVLLLSRRGGKGAAEPRRRREDPWSDAEVTWLGARWSGALFLRDLRALTRGVALRRQLLRSGRGYLVSTLGIAALSLVPPLSGAFALITPSLPTPALLVYRTALLAALIGPFVLFGATAELSGAAVRLWRNELRLGTLPQLLTGPLSIRELLLQRGQASFVVGLPALLFALVLAVPGGMLFFHDPALALDYLALLFLAAATGAMLGMLQLGFLGAEMGGLGVWGLLLLLAGMTMGGVIGARMVATGGASTADGLLILGALLLGLGDLLMVPLLQRSAEKALESRRG